MSNKQKHDVCAGFFDGSTFYPHKKMCINGIDIVCPAKIDFSGSKARHATGHGEYLYALPSGFMVTENGKII